MTERNWAGNYAYRARALHRPTTLSELQELVARHRPGAEIQVDLLRGNSKKQYKVKLKNSEGEQKMSKRDIKYEWNGIVVEEVPYKELNELSLEGGVRIKSVEEGKFKDAGVREGFVISHVDKIPVDNVEDLNQILEFKKGGILVEGYYKEREKGVYGIDW